MVYVVILFLWLLTRIVSDFFSLFDSIVRSNSDPSEVQLNPSFVIARLRSFKTTQTFILRANDQKPPKMSVMLYSLNTGRRLLV